MGPARGRGRGRGRSDKAAAQKDRAARLRSLGAGQTPPRGKGGRGRRPKPDDDLEHLELSPGLLQRAHVELPGHKSPETKHLRAYVEFSKKLKMTYPEWPMLATPLGEIFKDERGVRIFLEYKRCKSTANPKNPNKIQLTSKTLFNHFNLLKRMLRICVQGDLLPIWAAAHGITTPLLRTQFQTWTLEDGRRGPPAVRNSYLTEEEIQVLCLERMKDEARGQPPSTARLLSALLLWLQSSRSLRHKTLRDIKWGHVSWRVDVPNSSASEEKLVGVVSVDHTKIGNFDIGKAAKAKTRSRLMFYDRISRWLFERWCQMADQDARDSEDYFFPYLDNEGVPDFSKPMARSFHDKACREAAILAGRALSDEELREFTSNCVRRGNAIKLADDIQQLLGASNARNGRAPTSTVDFKNYVPGTVLTMPGPLFHNFDEIDKAVKEYLASELMDEKAARVCGICGYPDCSCQRCLDMARSGCNSKYRHTCCLATLTRAGGKPLGRRPASGWPESEEQLQARAAAWAKYEVSDLPTCRQGVYAFHEPEAAAEGSSGSSKVKGTRRGLGRKKESSSSSSSASAVAATSTGSADGPAGGGAAEDPSSHQQSGAAAEKRKRKKAPAKISEEGAASEATQVVKKRKRVAGCSAPAPRLDDDEAKEGQRGTESAEETSQHATWIEDGRDLDNDDDSDVEMVSGQGGRPDWGLLLQGSYELYLSDEDEDKDKEDEDEDEDEDADADEDDDEELLLSLAKMSEEASSGQTEEDDEDFALLAAIAMTDSEEVEQE